MGLCCMLTVRLEISVLQNYMFFNTASSFVWGLNDCYHVTDQCCCRVNDAMFKENHKKHFDKI